MDETLARILSKASRLAYDINTSGEQSDPNINNRLTAIGFDLASIQFNEVQLDNLGGNKIDACYYGKIPVRNAVVLVFRGTLPPWLGVEKPDMFFTVLNDWANDGRFPLVKGKQLAGLVHEGFLGSLDRLWQGILDFGIKQSVADGAELYITGHSKGGGLAYLAAYRLTKTGTPPAAVYTFAAPRVGNHDFASAFDTLIQEAWRFEYRDDIVPHIPPDTSAWLSIFEGLHALHSKFPEVSPHLDLDSSVYSSFDKLMNNVMKRSLPEFSNYVSAGSLQFINWETSNILTDSIELATKRNLSLAIKLAEFKLDEIIKDHVGASDASYFP